MYAYIYIFSLTGNGEGGGSNKGHGQDYKVPSSVEALTIHVPLFSPQYKHP